MSQREREDAVNEVRILASVHHQMVIRYFDAFIENDKLFRRSSRAAATSAPRSNGMLHGTSP